MSKNSIAALAESMSNEMSVIDVQPVEEKEKRPTVDLPKKLILSGVSYLTDKGEQQAQFSGSIVIEGAQCWLRAFGSAADQLYEAFGAPRVDNEWQEDERWPERGMRLGLMTTEGATASVYEGLDGAEGFLAIDGHRALTGVGAILPAPKINAQRVTAEQFENE